MNDAVVGVVRVVIEKYMTTLWETTFCNSEAAGLQMSIPVLRMARSINAPAQIQRVIAVNSGIAVQLGCPYQQHK